MTRQSVTFTVPIRTQGTQNKREHWTAVSRRTVAIRVAVGLAAAGCRGVRGFKVRPVVVTLVRIWSAQAPRQGELDEHDNLPSALKPVVDEVTRLLGFASDRDPDIAFTYGQERGNAPAVRVLIQGPCRARTLIYDVEPGSAPEIGEPRVEWTNNRDRSLHSLRLGVRHPLDRAERGDLYDRHILSIGPEEHARAELLNNRGIPGSNDDEIAATMLLSRRKT